MNRLLRYLAVVLSTVAAGLTIASSSASASMTWCSTPPGPPPGTYICEYGVTPVIDPLKNLHWFVVGVSSTPGQNPIYDTVRDGAGVWTPWHNLGGSGRSAVNVDFSNARGMQISVLGTSSTGCRFFKYWTTTHGWYPSDLGWYPTC